MGHVNESDERVSREFGGPGIFTMGIISENFLKVKGNFNLVFFF